MVSLLDHFVRSPNATSLLLGMDKGQDSMDIEIRNEDIHGMRLRDLRLPSDVLVLSVRRKGQLLVSHGYTRRSEEHTSELQSHHDLVCRLLLEKKK